jgi:hypothetical protein
MSVLDQRRRRIIFFLVICLGLGPFMLVVISGMLNFNPRDIQFFGDDYQAEFTTDMGPAGRGTIVIHSKARKKLIVEEATQKQEFPFTPEGTYIDDGKDTGANPIFWVRFPPQQKMVRRDEFSDLINQRKVVDLTGLIGPRGAIYRVHNETTTILWSWILGSQFSHPLDILDNKGRVIAQGLYDTTCGIMEEMTVMNNNGLGALSLVSTDFPMNRNRNFVISYAFIVAGLILAHHFLWTRKNTPDRVLFKLETDLLILGVLAVFLDEYVDIWFFHSTGPWVLVTLHLLVTGFVFWRFGFWGIFPLFELFWAGALAAASRSVIPQLAMCPALIITWFAILHFQFRDRLKNNG